MRRLRVRPAVAVAVALLALVLSACGEQPDEINAEPEGPTEDLPDDPTPTDPDDPADDVEEPGEDAEEPLDETEPLAGTPGTEESAEEGEGFLAVTDVRVAAHDGFDRVVFELDGDGTAGWNVRYPPEGTPTSQGSGEPIEFEGAAALEVAIHGIAYPFDLPEGVEPWEGDRIDGPDGGAVVEVLNDTIFEGIQAFVVGVTGEHPFLVARFDDPQRIVVDVFHEGT